jgi:hypothetical protein
VCAENASCFILQSSENNSAVSKICPETLRIKRVLLVQDPVNKVQRRQLGIKELYQKLKKLQQSLDIWVYGWMLSFITKTFPLELKKICSNKEYAFFKRAGK